MSDTQIKELIIHIAQNCKGDGNFGATKLNKLLFFIDYYYYLRTGETLTGHTYVHKRYGPVPVGIEGMKHDMYRKGDIAIAIEDSGMYRQERVIALRDARLKNIDPNKLVFVQKAIEAFCRPEKSWNATQMSNYSHDTIAWLTTKEGEKINPISFLFGTVKDQNRIREEDIERARELEARYFPRTIAPPLQHVEA